MTVVAIETASLKLVPRTRDETLAMLDTMSAEHRAFVSADWLARVHRSAHQDPWLHGFEIVHSATGRAIGTCGFKGSPTPEGMVEIAYAINPDHQGNGFATEAAIALATFARADASVRVVRAHTLPEENASTRVLVKSGFLLSERSLIPKTVVCGGGSCHLRISSEPLPQNAAGAPATGCVPTENPPSLTDVAADKRG